MVRYFFHLVGERVFDEDKNGELFSSVEAAVAHAHVIAAELMADDPSYDPLAVSVTDENANELARVPVVKPRQAAKGQKNGQQRNP